MVLRSSRLWIAERAHVVRTFERHLPMIQTSRFARKLLPLLADVDAGFDPYGAHTCREWTRQGIRTVATDPREYANCFGTALYVLGGTDGPRPYLASAKGLEAFLEVHARPSSEDGADVVLFDAFGSNGSEQEISMRTAHAGILLGSGDARLLFHQRGYQGPFVLEPADQSRDLSRPVGLKSFYTLHTLGPFLDGW